VHPDDAAVWGVVDGEEVSVTSVETGATVEVMAELDDSMMRGVVSLPHGWGHDDGDSRLSVAADRPGVSFNELTDPGQRDSLTGNAALNGIAVRLAGTRASEAAGTGP